MWIFFRLSVDVEIAFIDARLSRAAWLGVPRICAQLDLAELLHGEAAPLTYSFWHPGQAAMAASAELVAERVEPA